MPVEEVLLSGKSGSLAMICLELELEGIEPVRLVWIDAILFGAVGGSGGRCATYFEPRRGLTSRLGKT